MKRLLIFFMIVGLMLSGCGKSDSPPPAPAKPANNLEAQKMQQSISFLGKSLGTMQRYKGFATSIQGTQIYGVNKGTSSQGSQSTVTLDITISNSPAAAHMRGTIKNNTTGATASSISVPVESYVVNGVIYQKLGSSGKWLKLKEEDVNVSVFAQSPVGPMKELLSLLIAVDKTKPIPSNATIVQQSKVQGTNTVSLTIDLSKIVNPANMSTLVQAALGSINDQNLKNLGLKLGDISKVKIENFKHFIVMDGTTGVLRSYDQTLLCDVPVEGGSVRVQQSIRVNVKNEFTDKIDLPSGMPK